MGDQFRASVKRDSDNDINNSDMSVNNKGYFNIRSNFTNNFILVYWYPNHQYGLTRSQRRRFKKAYYSRLDLANLGGM